MTYILPSGTVSPNDPVVHMQTTHERDEGVFYVRWWTRQGVKPSEQRFTSRKYAYAKSIEMQRTRPTARVEMLECIESLSRSVKPRSAIPAK